MQRHQADAFGCRLQGVGACSQFGELEEGFMVITVVTRKRQQLFQDRFIRIRPVFKKGLRQHTKGSFNTESLDELPDLIRMKRDDIRFVDQFMA